MVKRFSREEKQNSYEHELEGSRLNLPKQDLDSGKKSGVGKELPEAVSHLDLRDAKCSPHHRDSTVSRNLSMS